MSRNPNTTATVRILLVDDQPANLLALKASLHDLNAELVEARSGEEALQFLAQHDFAVVLLDVHMPGLDGFETAKQIRQRSETRFTPIIFQTAFETERDIIEKAYTLGAVDFLIKPLMPVVLRAKVTSFIELYNIREQVRQQEAQLRQAERRGFQEKLAEENARLDEQREWLRVTLTSIGDAVIATDPDGKVTFLNPVAEALTGWSGADAMGRPLVDVFHIVNEHTGAAVEDPVAKVMRLGTVVGLANHTILIRRDQTTCPIDDSAAPIKDANGRILGCVLIFRDITQRRRLEKEMAARQAASRSLAAIVESSDDAIVSKSLDSIIQSWNAAAERLFGYRAEEAIGKHITLIIPSERVAEEEAIIARLRAGERIEHFETVRRHSSGRPVHVSLTISPIKDDRGLIVGASKTARDITERRQTLRRLAAQDAVTRALAEAPTLEAAGPEILRAVGDFLEWPVGALWYVDPQQNELHCSAVWQAAEVRAPAFVALSRQSRFPRGVGLVGRVWNSAKAAWIPDVAQDPNFPRAAVANKEGLHAAFGFPVMLGDRVLGVIEFFSREIRQPDDDLLQMMTTIGAQIGLFIDRKGTEESLRESEQRLRLALEAGRMGSWEWNVRTNQVLWTPGLEAIHGLTPGTFPGSFEAYQRDIHPEDREMVLKTIRATIEQGVDHHIEYRIILPTGVVRWVEGRGKMFSDASGAPLRMIGVCTDITERKQAEQALREADRRKDEFLAVLAHELRNPLAPIRNAIELLYQTDDRALIHEARDLMERQVNQMVRLVDDLMDVSRITRGKVQLQKEVVELGPIVRSAVEASRPLIDARAQTLTVALPSTPIYLDADATRLAQVVANLLNNAAKYTEKGGQIWLTAEDDRATEPSAASFRSHHVTISVRDTGIGIAREYQPHIFETFAQVAPALERSQGGLGIGLSLVRAIVEMHQGTVEVRSEGPGKGSEFIVRLPVTRAPATEPELENDGAIDSRSRRILVVDDNRDAADSLVILLRNLGHQTHTAYDGQQAIQVAAEFEPEVILLDIGMPRLHGYDAARHIRQQAWGRDLALIALTGWGQAEDKRRAFEAGFDHHLTKPVDPKALTKLLASLKPAKERMTESV